MGKRKTRFNRQFVRVRSYHRQDGKRVRGHRRSRVLPQRSKYPVRTIDDEQQAILLLRHNKTLVMEAGALNVLESSGMPLSLATDRILKRAGFSSKEIKKIKELDY